MALVPGCVGCVGFECSRLNAQDWFNPWQQDLNSVSATTMKVSQVVVQPDGHSMSQLSIAVYGCHQQGSKRAFQHSKADIEGVLTHALIKLVNFQGTIFGQNAIGFRRHLIAIQTIPCRSLDIASRNPATRLKELKYSGHDNDLKVEVPEKKGHGPS